MCIVLYAVIFISSRMIVRNPQNVCYEDLRSGFFSLCVTAVRDSKKAGMLTFSDLNYSSLSSKLQEKSAYSRRAVAQKSYLQVGTSRLTER